VCFSDAGDDKGKIKEMEGWVASVGDRPPGRKKWPKREYF
jgi:hypothetical protein